MFFSFYIYPELFSQMKIKHTRNFGTKLTGTAGQGKVDMEIFRWLVF